MALFQRNPYADKQHQPLFSIGMNKTMLIVGLGNIGKAYDNTRHNIGFACLDAFAKAHDFEPWTNKKDLKCILSSATLGDTRVILCKPTTYMNLSGEAVQKVAHFYKITADQIVIVHDDLDVPFGQIRMRVGGSSAGNNGIKSIIQHFGELESQQTGRIRIGIDGDKPAGMETSDYVLARFSKEEQGQLESLEREAVSIMTECVFSQQLPHDTRRFTD